MNPLELMVDFSVIPNLPRSAFFVSDGFSEVVDALDKIGMKGGRGFDFNGNEPGSVWNQKIHLVPLGVPVKVEVWRTAGVQQLFYLIDDKEVLVQAAAKRIPLNLLFRIQVQQKTGKAGVHEEKFG